MDDASLVELLDEARTARAMAARRGRRVAGRAAEEAGSLRALLADLAERRAGVTVSTVAGSRTSGRVTGLGADVVVIDERWLRLSAITSIRPEEGGAPAGDHDDDRGAGGPSLVALLAAAATERPVVHLVLAGGERVTGRLVAVGEDVVTLAADDAAGRAAYVSAASIVEVFRSG